MAEKEFSYTEAMAEIERIMENLRSEKVDVDTLTTQVKRASELIALCKGKLHATEEEVKKLFNE
ncbi:MAG: exodeoxyribonuclease VII small subunit [Alistipes sp.]|jgi:exodeoxyribonuclease VII small subunit|nr:exodeoxyribonuclease VII small subunit [Alistipes sp.]